MKKQILELTIFVAIFSTPVSVLAETVSYNDECISFEYDDEMYGTIEKSVEDGIRRYRAESFGGDFAAYIHVMNIDNYVSTRSNEEKPLTRENYQELILSEDDDTVFTDDRKEEVKSISKWDGSVTYEKIVDESDTTFILVGYDGVNDNESMISKGFMEIYDSVSASESFSSIDFSTVDITDSKEIIFGKKEAYDYTNGKELDEDTKRFIGRAAQEILKYNIDSTVDLEIGNSGEDMIKMQQVDNIVEVDGSFSHNFKDYEFKVEFSYEMENEWSGTYDTIYVSINNIDLYGSYRELETK